MENLTTIQKTEIKIRKLLEILETGLVNPKLSKDDLKYFQMKTKSHLDDLMIIKETLKWGKGNIKEDYFELPLEHINEYTNGAYYLLVPRQRKRK